MRNTPMQNFINKTKRCIEVLEKSKDNFRKINRFDIVNELQEDIEFYNKMLKELEKKEG